jgi:hypothetical protein
MDDQEGNKIDPELIGNDILLKNENMFVNNIA